MQHKHVVKESISTQSSEGHRFDCNPISSSNIPKDKNTKGRSVEVDPLGSRERGRAQGKLAQGQGECYSGDKATQPLDNKASPAPGAR